MTFKDKNENIIQKYINNENTYLGEKNIDILNLFYN